jgi:hypothetical protein
VLPKPLNLDVLAAVLEHVLSDSHKSQAETANATSPPGESSAIEEASPADDVSTTTNERCPANEVATAEGDQTTGRRVGTCPICGIGLYAEIDDSLTVPARIRAIHAVRRAHVLSHTAGDIARVPLRTRLLQMPIGQRRILADWVYSELRHQWGDADRLGVHSIDEALNSVTMHRLWQDALRCNYPSCLHGD